MEASRLGVVLDASAAIALLRDEPGAHEVESLLRDSPVARMSTVSSAEVIDVMVRRHGGDIDEVLARVDDLCAYSVSPVTPSLELAERAGELRARHYRPDRRVSLADCFVLATAQPGDRIVTGDVTLAAIAHDEGLETVDLRR